jgi:hypothetical protein
VLGLRVFKNISVILCWSVLASSTTKTVRHDIAEILLKVALNTKNKSIKTLSLCEQENQLGGFLRELAFPVPLKLTNTK